MKDIFYDKHRYLCEILRGNYEGMERVAYELANDNLIIKWLFESDLIIFIMRVISSRYGSAIALNEFDEVVTVNNLNNEQMDKELKM